MAAKIINPTNDKTSINPSSLIFCEKSDIEPCDRYFKKISFYSLKYNIKADKHLYKNIPIDTTSINYKCYQETKLPDETFHEYCARTDDQISFTDIPAGSVCVFDADRFGFWNMFIMIDYNPVIARGIFPRIRLQDGIIQLGQDQLVDKDHADKFLEQNKSKYKCSCYSGQGYSGCNCIEKPMAIDFAKTFIQMDDSHEYVIATIDMKRVFESCTFLSILSKEGVNWPNVSVPMRYF